MTLEMALDATDSDGDSMSPSGTFAQTRNSRVAIQNLQDRADHGTVSLSTVYLKRQLTRSSICQIFGRR